MKEGRSEGLKERNLGEKIEKEVQEDLHEEGMFSIIKLRGGGMGSEEKTQERKEQRVRCKMSQFDQKQRSNVLEAQ